MRPEPRVFAIKGAEGVPVATTVVSVFDFEPSQKGEEAPLEARRIALETTLRFPSLLGEELLLFLRVEDDELRKSSIGLDKELRLLGVRPPEDELSLSAGDEFEIDQKLSPRGDRDVRLAS